MEFYLKWEAEVNKSIISENPVISVIVPVYKVENHIRECVESIRNQSFLNIEIILVDDGSPDQCPEICDEYAEKDRRIKVIHQKNSGLSAARNAGIEISKGLFLCFIDSDDYISPRYCEVLYDCLVNTKYDFSVCAVERFIDGTKVSPKDVLEEKIVLSNESFLEWQLSRKSEFSVCNKLYRRELFDLIHFEVGRVHEDVIWSAELASCLYSGVVCSNQKLYYYRQRLGGIVSEGSRQCSADRVYAGECLIHCVEKTYPQLFDKALIYAVQYPWSFVDKIYVKFKQVENRQFMNALSKLIREYLTDLMRLDVFSPLVKYRMKLFSKSRLLYAFNAYGRLLRNYVCRLMGKNPYESQHSI